MKIDKVEALKVDIPLEKNFAGGTYSVDKRTVIITKIFTSDGLVSEVFSGDDRFRSDLIIKVIRSSAYCKEVLFNYNFEVCRQVS